MKLCEDVLLQKRDTEQIFCIRKNIFACLLSIPNIITLSPYEQVCLIFF